MALGTKVRETNVDFNQGAFAFYGLRSLGSAADLAFGLRVNTPQGDVTLKRIGVSRSQDRPLEAPCPDRTPSFRRRKEHNHGERQSG